MNQSKAPDKWNSLEDSLKNPPDVSPESPLERVSPWTPRHKRAHSVKSHVLDYWSDRAESFAELHMKEFEGVRHDMWASELFPLLGALEASVGAHATQALHAASGALAEQEAYASQAPFGAEVVPCPLRRLRALDVGCGSGFFALLLAERGYETYGIDLVPDMIREARKASRELGIPVRFSVMDAEDPQFDPATFDVIVTRNLTWTLPHLEHAYQAWHDLLVPGGMFINFDADYTHEERMCIRKVDGQSSHDALSDEQVMEYEHIKEHLVVGQRLRPQWDVELLTSAGFSDIDVDDTVSDRIFPHVDEFYNPTRMFRILACRNS